jgi:hypothetical protein
MGAVYFNRHFSSYLFLRWLVVCKAAYMFTDTPQFSLTQLNWIVSRHVLNISFIHVYKTQLNTTLTQLNWSFKTCTEPKTQLNSTDLSAPSPALDIRDPVDSNMQMPDNHGYEKSSR